MNCQIYCDGACSNNGYQNSRGGYAAALFTTNSSIPDLVDGDVIENATNNICELRAMIAACEMGDQYLIKYPNEFVEIYSDSAYVLNCYSQHWWRKWINNDWQTSKKEPVKNRELWEELIPYFTNEHFIFVKVKGHSTDKRNNLVDSIAVDMRKKEDKC